MTPPRKVLDEVIPAAILDVVAEHPGATRTQIVHHVRRQIENIEPADVLQSLPIESNGLLRVEKRKFPCWRYWPADAGGAS